jgi:predicted kinase
VIISPDDYLTDLDGVYRWSPARVKAAWEHARSGLHDAVLWGAPTKVVVVCGIPASGKSTWIRKNRESNTVYFDACLDLPWKRKKILNLIEDAAKNAPTTAALTRAGRNALPRLTPAIDLVWCHTDVIQAHRWNEQRTPDRRVPREVIDKMASYFVQNDPDGEAEGFDSYRVIYQRCPMGCSCDGCREAIERVRKILGK